MNNWIAYAEQRPEAAVAYRWRLPSVGVPGLFVTFLAHMRTRGAGHESVLSPLFDYWDGYRVILPQGVQWQPAEEHAGVKWHDYGGVRAEGVDPCACPYCEKVPLLKGAKRYNDGSLSHGASPHEYNTWWLECCAWARTPHYKDPRDLVARRDAVLIRLAPPTE
ncbi:hypothetical protein ACIOWK_27270 [Pseudomonas protegens]|uniref:hypothetical protein n=1 Tax=Pseudomonas protegens TaxID=380021 RepID=UPI003814DE3F